LPTEVGKSLKSIGSPVNRGWTPPLSPVVLKPTMPDADRPYLPRSGDPAAPLIDFIDQLRGRDPAFAEASVLCEEEMGEWQAAVYLLTGCDPLWRALGAAVMTARSMAPVLSEIENSRQAWSASEDEAMAWAAHFWDFRRHPASFPSTFQSFLFERWIVALHLRQGLAPAIP
jgi:hypothetical protein